MKRNRARIVTPWNLSVGINLSLFLMLWLTPLAQRNKGIEDLILWMCAAAFGYTCWRIVFERLPLNTGSCAVPLLASAGFTLYIAVAFIAVGITYFMGVVPDAPVIYFTWHNPSYAAHMMADRFNRPLILILCVAVSVGLYATWTTWRDRTGGWPEQRLGWLPTIAGILMIVPPGLTGTSHYGLESNVVRIANQALRLRSRPPLDLFVLSRPRLGPQSCDPEYRPNILFFQLEEISFNQFGRAKNGKSTIPFLDHWSAQDPKHFRFFDRHYTNSAATEVALYSMLVGLDAAQDGVRLGRMPVVWDYLQACGYTTLYSVPFDFHWGGLGARLRRPDGTYGLDYQFDTSAENVPFDYELAVRDDWAVDRFIETLPPVMSRNKPFFAIVNLQTSHFMGAAVSILGKDHFACGRDHTGFDAYECGVYEVDSQVRRVVLKLTELGLLDDTVVIGTPDHGADVNGRRTRLESFYQEVVHVPLFVYLPEHLLARHPELGTHSNNVTQHADLLPTILQLAGFVRTPGNAEFLDALTGTSIFDVPADRPVFMNDVNAMRDWPHRGFSILFENRFKYIVSRRARELYDLQVDPDEERNLIGRPDLTREAAAISRLVQSNGLLRTVALGE